MGEGLVPRMAVPRATSTFRKQNIVCVCGGGGSASVQVIGNVSWLLFSFVSWDALPGSPTVRHQPHVVPKLQGPSGHRLDSPEL